MVHLGEGLLKFRKERKQRLQLKDGLWSIRVMMDFKESRLRQWNIMNKLGAIKYVSVYGRKEILFRTK